jgi:hypothetical protein
MKQYYEEQQAVTAAGISDKGWRYNYCYILMPLSQFK